MLTFLPPRLSPRPRAAVASALPVLLALALLGVPASGAASGTAESQPRAASVTVSPRSPMAGERTVFSGRLPGAGRPVALQRKAPSGWKVVGRARVTSGGKYRLAVRVRKSGAYRVQAPPAAGRRGFTSARIGVKVKRQAAAISSLDAPFVKGLGRTVTARVTPGRKGRVVVLQRLSGGTWKDVAKARSARNGVVKLRFASTKLGHAHYRVAGTSFRGSSAVRSARRSLRTARVTELLSPGTSPGDDNFSQSLSADGRWVAFTSDSQLLATDTDAQNDVYLFDRRTGALTHLLPAANSHTNSPVLSANGRFVALQSLATDLAGEADSDYDVFVLDRSSGDVELISRTSGGVPANSDSYVYDISDDGRFVAFASTASNLVSTPPPTTSVRHAYVHDRTTDTNRGLDRIGLGWSDANIYGISLSGDGSAVAFQSGDTDLDPGDVDGTAIFRWDIAANGTLSNRTTLTPGIDSHSPALDGDGDLLVFTTDEALVAGDTNGQDDVYLRTAAGTFVSASPLGPGESYSGAISGGGRFIALSTESTQPG
ncbi:hypothetical protein, partial [Nocardioides sp.]|uniref:hypothetical protein n=1 Tax=Nocardioides sp. TaxID=35761 RepID=UPI002736946B